MVSISSLAELKAVKAELEKIRESEPALFEIWLHVIHLTRQLQFKYHYMGCLITNEDPGKYAPRSVQSSVISMYQNEVRALMEKNGAEKLKDLLKKYPKIGYNKISLLSLGQTPESLVGVSVA
ncbi:hypothetical protein ACFOU2_01275 [Bacillus songklensis]|uniref:Uncharacterized protein n=1 Tax=Bacillus songklensis TaxID=1069116 RepID=A0ABV8AX40_9BACI